MFWSTEMMLSFPWRGSGPRSIIAVSPPRKNSAAEKAAGAPGRSSQASTAGSKHGNIMAKIRQDRR